MTPTQPPAPTGASAREIVSDALCTAINDWSIKHMHLTAVVQGTTDATLAALAEAGYVVVRREDVDAAVDAMNYVKGTYFWEKWGYQEPYDRLAQATFVVRRGEGQGQ